MNALPYAGDDRRDGVVGLAFAMKNVAQLLLMCDGHDIGLSVDGGALERTAATGAAGGVPEALAAEPIIFIYDNYPGGIGFSRPLFEMHEPLLDRTRHADCRLPVRIRLPVVCRARRQHRSARQDRGAAHPHGADRRGGRLAVDLSSRLRAIVRPGPSKTPVRELTYEPDTGVRDHDRDRSRGRPARRNCRAERVRPVPDRRAALRVGSLARRDSDRRLRPPLGRGSGGPRSRARDARARCGP